MSSAIADHNTSARLDPLLKMSATALAAAVTKGEVTPLAVVDAHIARLEATAPLNGLVGRRFEEARAEARAAEAVLAGKGPKPPFTGVPCTIKEAIALRGSPNTSGLYHRRDVKAQKDATAVARLRAAGFIPLGVTNVPEACFWFETDNLVYGRTKNPYDARRSAGGSSGGEGAVIGAGGSPVGLGSDVGGSIRMPSASCGIFGLKPSHNVIPLTGHWPHYDDESGEPSVRRDVQLYNTLGPMARRAEDLLPMLRIMAGPDGCDTTVQSVAFGDPAKVRWRGRKVYLLAEPRIARAWSVSPELAAATRRSADALAQEGATIEEIDPALFWRALLIWSCTLDALDLPRVDKMLGGGRRPLILWELFRHLAGRPRLTLPALEYCLGEKIFGLFPGKGRFIALGSALRQRVEEMLNPGNVLLMPTHPRTAPRHWRPMLRPFDYTYTAIFNILRVPVVAAPVGFDRDGLPLGVQIAAPFGQDHVAAAAALALERAFGGWRPPQT